MDTLKWLLESPMPTIWSFFVSCILTFYFRLPTTNNDGGHDLLLVALPDVSMIVPWLWTVTAFLFILYAIVGKYLRTRW